ncbi:hypothetical protein [Ammoniphilus sp. 3BR4]|uniref:hypothetical protein n=1 Tax=Ammoniphilus sp. 3BR4 TaxID=3158265 RepID=UPI00346798B1
MKDPNKQTPCESFAKAQRKLWGFTFFCKDWVFPIYSLDCGYYCYILHPKI